MTRKTEALETDNRRAAKVRWPGLMDANRAKQLAILSQQHKFSINSGELVLLNGAWYANHAGLLALSRRNHCLGIRVQPGNVSRLKSEEHVGLEDCGEVRPTSKAAEVATRILDDQPAVALRTLKS